jgi:hypothetical protein
MIHRRGGSLGYWNKLTGEKVAPSKGFDHCCHMKMLVIFHFPADAVDLFFNLPNRNFIEGSDLVAWGTFTKEVKHFNF